MNNRTCLIDGDIIAYRCGFASEHRHYELIYKVKGKELTKTFDGKKAMNDFLKEFAEEIIEYEWTSELEVEPIEFALSTVKHMLENIRKATKSDKYEVYLSAHENFRQKVATIQKYKGNRDEKRKPIHHPEIIEYLKKYHNAIVIENLEADDVLADVQTSRNAAGQDTVIASIDKDLLQIPGKHYNFVTEKGLMISPESGRKRLYAQLLTGDATDNIPGIKGLGPKTAEKLLAECETEDDMQVVVEDQWQTYLAGDKAPDWIVEAGETTFTCWNWKHELVHRTLDGIITELTKLLKIGIPQ